MQIQTSNTLHNAIMEAGSKDRPPMLAPGWIDKEIPISEGSPITITEKFQETYKNVSQDIRDQLNAEAEAVQIILTGIDNDIYSTVDACPNACEMWKAIERLKREWQRFVTLVKQNQELKTVLYHKLYDILKQHQHEVNEIRAERIARVANPLALVAQQQSVYHPQTHSTHYTQNSSTRSQQAATKNRGKAIVNSPQPIYDQEPSMVAEDDETSKDKEIDKLMALISLSSAGYENQRIGNVARARETVGSTAVQKSGIQCYNCKEFGHVTMECQKPKRVKDAAYHREKMLLYKQEEAGIQLNAEQADWRDDTNDDELEDQELEAHYMYMAQLQEVSLDAADFGPIFDDEPLQKVSTDDHYNVFAMESKHPEQSISVHDTYLIEQDAQNVIIDSLDMSYDREEIDQNDDDNDLSNEQAKLARCNSIEYASQMEIECAKKEAQIKLYKVIALENKVEVLDNIVYKTGQSVQTINMLNNKCRTSFAKPEFLKKAQRANPRLCLNEEMVFDLRYFNSLELEVDSLRSQLETQKTQFLNEIGRISREYYYADHMNAILGMYTELDKDLKAQLQDKGIVISELKKLIEKLKGKSVDTKFEKSSVIRQPNAFKSQRPSVLGKPTTFSNSFVRKDFLKPKSVTQNNVSNNFSKPVTAQTLPPNKKSILKNTNVLAPGMYNVHTESNQTRTSQLPQDSSKTNKRVSFSTGVIPTTIVSRQQLKRNPIGDRVMLASETNQKPKNITRKLYEHVSKTCSWWYPKFTPSGYKWKPKSGKENVNPNTSMPLGSLVEIVLFIVDSGCSKHMTRNLKLLINFVDKFLGMVKFRNDQIEPILGYEDLVQGAVTIKRVYCVEGLNHNLFSDGQFCDVDLENDIVVGLSKLKFIKDHLCSSCELGKAKRKSFHTKLIPSSKSRLQFLHMDLCGPMRVASINGKRYVLVIVDDYSRYTWTHFLRSKDETPEVFIDFLRLVQRGL
nr:ribonuclease H-like domain-containing protein [Tanacetum cinerariifolium]